MPRQLFGWIPVWLVILLGLSAGRTGAQVTTPASCVQQCRYQTVMFCQVPDGGIAIPASEVAACKACVARSPECGTGVNGLPAEITSHADGAELASDPVVFAWNAGTNISEYTLVVGTSPGDARLGSFGPGRNRSASVRMPDRETTIYVTLYSKPSSGPNLSKSYTFSYPGPPGIDLSGAPVRQSSGRSGNKPGTAVMTNVEPAPYWYVSFPRCVSFKTVRLYAFAYGALLERENSYFRLPDSYVQDMTRRGLFVDVQRCNSYSGTTPRPGMMASGFLPPQSGGSGGQWTSLGNFRPPASGGFDIPVDTPIQGFRISRQGPTMLAFAKIAFVEGTPSRGTSTGTGTGTGTPTTNNRPPLPPNYIPTKALNSLSGVWYVQGDPNRQARIEHAGASLTFINEWGNRSRGRFIGYDMSADDWQQVRATIEEDETRIRWATGTSWFRNPRTTQTTTPPSVPTVRYLGCFKDTDNFATGGYDLNGFLNRSNTNTPQACVAECRQRGFAFAGVQYGQSCLCGNSYGRYGPSNACTMPCTGDRNQSCGGPYANAVYSTGLAFEERRRQ